MGERDVGVGVFAVPVALAVLVTVEQLNALLLQLARVLQGLADQNPLQGDVYRIRDVCQISDRHLAKL